MRKFFRNKKYFIFLFSFILLPIQFLYSELIPITQDLKSDDEVLKIIEPFRKEVIEKTQKIIGESDYGILKSSPEGLLGNLICDSIMNNLRRRSIEVDLAFWNNRGIRGSFPKGHIKVADAYEVMPFENELYIVHFTGSKLMKVFKFLLDYGGEPISGMRIEATKKKVKSITKDGKEIEKNKIYKVATSNYLILSGWLSDFVKKERIDKLGLKARDVLIEELYYTAKNGNKIGAKLDGRFTIR